MSIIPAVVDPEEELEKLFLRESVERCLAKLSPHQAEALCLRICEEKCYERIGEQLSCSPERARRLVATALRRLRHPYMARHLRDFL